MPGGPMYLYLGILTLLFLAGCNEKDPEEENTADRMAQTESPSASVR